MTSERWNRKTICVKKRGIEDSVDASIQRPEDYIKNRKDRLITAENNNTNNIRTNRTTTTKQKWEEKQLYRYFKKQTDQISRENTEIWQRKENLKKETEFLQLATQNNAIRINLMMWKSIKRNRIASVDNVII